MQFELKQLRCARRLSGLSCKDTKELYIIFCIYCLCFFTFLFTLMAFLYVTPHSIHFTQLFYNPQLFLISFTFFNINHDIYNFPFPFISYMIDISPFILPAALVVLSQPAPFRWSHSFCKYISLHFYFQSLIITTLKLVKYLFISQPSLVRALFKGIADIR